MTNVLMRILLIHTQCDTQCSPHVQYGSLNSYGTESDTCLRGFLTKKDQEKQSVIIIFEVECSKRVCIKAESGFKVQVLD